MGATIFLLTGEGATHTMGNTIALGTCETDQLSGGLEIDLTFNFAEVMDFCGGRWWNAATTSELIERAQGFLDARAAEPELIASMAPSNGWGDLDSLAEMAKAVLALLDACPSARLMVA